MFVSVSPKELARHINVVSGRLVSGACPKHNWKIIISQLLVKERKDKMESSVVMGGVYVLAAYATLRVARWALYKIRYERNNTVKGKQILITGACGALGTSLSHALAKKGAHTLVLWDLREAGLKDVQASIQATYPDVRVLYRKVNLLQNEDFKQAAEEIIKDKSVKLDVIINGAGITFSGSIGEITKEQDEATIKINYLSQVELVKIMMPYLESHGGGHLVGVASLGAFNAGAGMTTYCASKFALRGFYEGLACELVIRSSPVSISVFCPGAFQSQLFQGYNIPFIPAMTPDEVAGALIHDSVERRFAISMYPVHLSFLCVFSAICNVLGVLFVVPFNPMTNWKGGKYAQEVLSGKL